MKKSMNSSINSKKLAELVRENECLYNFNNPSFKDKILKRKIWKMISLNLNSDVSVCEKRWRSMRDMYNRELRKSRTNLKVKRKRWRFMDCMLFLKDLKKEDESISEILSPKSEDNETQTMKHHSSIIQDIYDPLNSSNTTKIDDVCENLRLNLHDIKDYDPDLLFALSIVKRLQNLSNKDNSLIKIKLLQLFHDIEFNN